MTKNTTNKKGELIERYKSIVFPRLFKSMHTSSVKAGLGMDTGRIKHGKAWVKAFKLHNLLVNRSSLHPVLAVVDVPVLLFFFIVLLIRLGLYYVSAIVSARA